MDTILARPGGSIRAVTTPLVEPLSASETAVLTRVDTVG